MITTPKITSCPACGERVNDRDTMRRIEARSPAYQKTSRAGAQ